MSKKTFIVSDAIKEQLKTVPQEPGVYLMRDSTGEIIYVGKAKKLKNRLSSYFRGFDSHVPKVQTMVVNIRAFEYILTDSEMEALILEANLIKKHLPRFNILLKDDKSYPYIAITLGEDFPRVFMTRETGRAKTRYFGPYTSSEHVRTALEVIQTIFPIRECSKRITDKIERPCLNYHIGRCAGVCNHKITKEAYAVYINQILSFLSGDKQELIHSLKGRMERSAEVMAYEQAALYRDQIESLMALNEKQKVMQVGKKNQDYIAYFNFESRTCVMVFQLRDGKIEGRESYEISNGEAETPDQILTSFLTQYYSGHTDIPKEIFISREVERQELYSEWLSKCAGYKVQLTVPKRGEKLKTIHLVERNAKEYIMKFQDRIDKEEAQRKNAENELRTLLDFPQNLPLDRIEAYDISNTSGIYSVGSMVVFQRGKKKRSDYRRYRVKTIEGPNDYGSMQEILYRRFKRGLEEQKHLKESGSSFSVFPDLILIDGGKGHVNAALDVLNALKIYIPVAGMVKDQFHITDDLIFENQPRGLKEYNAAFRLIAEIQDEVHRFAIEYHKSIRSKEMTHSILDEIEGIGPKKRIALLKHFKAIEAIQSATVEMLIEVDGIHLKNANEIYKFFRNNAENSE